MTKPNININIQNPTGGYILSIDGETTIYTDLAQMADAARDSIIAAYTES